MNNYMRKIFNSVISKYFKRESVITAPIIGIVALVIILSFLSPYFFTISNIINILRQVSIISIVAVGMTYAILTGGIDLSVGSIVALSGVVTTVLLKNFGLNLGLCILTGLFVGALVGAGNGIMIVSKIKMPPFIATLAMMGIVRGIALVITSGRPIFQLPDQFSFIGSGFLSRIPFPVILMFVVYTIAYINLNYTRSGIHFYSVGGNEEASRLSGIKISTVKFRAYVISGLTASLAGIILASRVMVGEPIAGYMYELDSIAAVVIGGTSMFGGEGSIIGTLIGALLMGILRNGLNLLNVSSYWQQIVLGLVIALTVSFNILRRK